MKKKIFWIILLLLMLLLSACTVKPVGKEPTQAEQLAQSGDVCLGCEEQYVSGQLNADFGLCRECMVREGAIYCQDCNTPGYVRNMVYGRCQNCSASAKETTAEPAVETVEAVDTVACVLCGRAITSSQSLGGFCAACYADMLRPEEEEEDDKCRKCGVILGKWEGYDSLCSVCFAIEMCDFCNAYKVYKDDLCKYCYNYRTGDTSGECSKCGVDDVYKDGYCFYCHPSFSFECKKCGYGWPTLRPADGICPDCKCDECGAVLASRDDRDGLCDPCALGRCRKCGTDYSEGYDGFCYYCHPNYGFTCTNCGQYIKEHRPSNGFCEYCYGYFCLNCSGYVEDLRPADGICPDCKCDVCGKTYGVGEGYGGECLECIYDRAPKCKSCGIPMPNQGCIDGMCEGCYYASQHCIKCGTDSNEYDGYCYYCHPDFGFYCKKCGFYIHAHPYESGLCFSCQNGD